MRYPSEPTGGPWAPYTPDDKAPWDLRRVVHLHRRAGFAATWAELQRDLKDGPVKSVDRLLKGAAGLHTPGDFAATADLLADSAVGAGEIGRLKAWWFYRLVFSPDPLAEKLTLLWHDHFATGYRKVRDVGLMRRQNDALRWHGLGKFADLLTGCAREPALLIYLDAPANGKGHPNENLARELMELFTLGIGHYSEKDVKEAARALTGWTVEDGQFAFAAWRHDAGAKTILGKSGAWTGDDLVGMLLAHPATPSRIVFKLSRLFFGEKGVPEEARKSLTAELRERKLDLAWAVATILRSKLFFAAENVGNRVLGPVEFVVGCVRALGLFDPAPSTLALADWSARIGQDLFEPPNVGGWPSGRGWVHTRGLIARANFADALLSGPNAGRSVPYDALASAKTAKAAGFTADAEGVLTYHHRLLFGTEPTAETRRRLAGANSAVLLASPEAQLG
jgi:uncharacterized protein (DUF1800 family)